MKQDRYNQMIARANFRNDGMYTLAGVHYRVREGKVTHYSDFGTVIEISNGFDCVVGNYEWDMGDYEGVKLLRAIK